MSTPVLSQNTQNADDSDNLNLLFYYHETTSESRFTRFIPFYTYEYSPQKQWDKFFFIPLLSGYETEKNKSFKALPFLAPYNWYNIFLSMGAAPQRGNRDAYSFISIPLGTFLQEERYPGRYEALKWYSLPILSFYQSEHLFVGESQINKATIETPFTSFSDYTFQLDSATQRIPLYELYLSPIRYLLGQEGVDLMKLARWGQDREFRLLDFAGFSFFTNTQTFHHYPGANLTRFQYHDSDPREGLQHILTPSNKPPLTHIGFLDPILSFESRPNGYIRWEFLPLFHYHKQADASAFTILPLGVEFGSRGIRWAPKPKLFPLLYHNEHRGTWDILWPLFRYQNDPIVRHRRVNLRFLFEYDISQDRTGQSRIDVSICQRLLLAYNQIADEEKLAILRGVLFSHEKTAETLDWSFMYGILGYGRNERGKYLKLFFIKIKL